MFAEYKISHRVDAQPHGHQFMIHVSRAEITIACFLVSFLARGK